MKKILLTFACLLLFSTIFSQVNPNHHWVKGYTRKDGTVVKGHYRTNPNSSNRDNYSTLGNTNPWTGEIGTIPPDNRPLCNNDIYRENIKYQNTDFERTLMHNDLLDREIKRRYIDKYIDEYIDVDIDEILKNKFRDDYIPSHINHEDIFESQSIEIQETLRESDITHNNNSFDPVNSTINDVDINVEEPNSSIIYNNNSDNSDSIDYEQEGRNNFYESYSSISEDSEPNGLTSLVFPIIFFSCIGFYIWVIKNQ